MKIETQALNQINHYLNQFKKNGYSFSNPLKAQYCFESIIKNGTQKVKLLVYFGKKGIRTVIQGNNEEILYQKVNQIIFGDKFHFENKIELPEPEEYIGIDESGKGDFFGPLVIAAAFANKFILNELKKIGVKDSKELNDIQIQLLFPQIKKILGNNYSVFVLNPKKYNHLYNQVKNLNKLLAYGHSKSLAALLDKVNCSIAISDKFGKDKLINEILEKKKIEIKLYQITKGERYTAVAAASIIARYYVIKWFEEKSKELNLKLLKGASGKVDDIARKLKLKSGSNEFQDLVKIHFKNFIKISSN